MEDIFTYVIIALFVVLSVFLVVEYSRQYIEFRKKIREFQSKYIDYKKIDFTKIKTILYVLAALVVWVLTIYLYSLALDRTYTVAYICLGCLLLSMALDCQVKDCCYVSKDGFFYQNEYHRFRNLRTIRIEKGFFDKSWLIYANGQEERCRNSIAKKLEEEYKNWKNMRKKAK